MDFNLIILLLFVFMILISIISFSYYIVRHQKLNHNQAKEQELLAQTISYLKTKDSK